MLVFDPIFSVSDVKRSTQYISHKRAKAFNYSMNTNNSTANQNLIENFNLVKSMPARGGFNFVQPNAAFNAW